MRTNRLPFFVKRTGFALGVFLLAGATAVFAAQTAKVEQDNTIVLSSPTGAKRVLKRLKKGDTVTAANAPIQGFYKIKTSDGVIGWVPANSLAVGGGGGGAGKQAAPRRHGSSSGNKFTVRALGTFDMFTLSALNTQLGYDALANGIGFGGEIGYAVSDSVTILVRAELISKSISSTRALDTGTLNYTQKLSTFPIMGGAQFKLFQSGEVTGHFAAMGGLGMGTYFSSTSVDQGNVETKLTDSPIALLGKFDLDWNVSPSFGLFIEAGYRKYLAKAVVPAVATSTAGSDIFQDTSGNYVATKLDFSGIEFGGGIVVHF